MSAKQGGILHYPSDWDAQCEARCRKTGEQCPHKCKTQIPNTMAGSVKMDTSWFSVTGRPARLCDGHYLSWRSRAERLLTLPLINGGHLSPYNRHGYGSVVVEADRIDFDAEPVKVKIPKAWGWVGWRGIVPEGLLERLPQYEPLKEPTT